MLVADRLVSDCKIWSINLSPMIRKMSLNIFLDTFLQVLLTLQAVDYIFNCKLCLRFVVFDIWVFCSRSLVIGLGYRSKDLYQVMEVFIDLIIDLVSSRLVLILMVSFGIFEILFFFLGFQGQILLTFKGYLGTLYPK